MKYLVKQLFNDHELQYDPEIENKFKKEFINMIKRRYSSNVTNYMKDRIKILSTDYDLKENVGTIIIEAYDKAFETDKFILTDKYEDLIETFMDELTGDVDNIYITYNNSKFYLWFALDYEVEEC